MVGDVVRMELSRQEVPLYGQVQVCVEQLEPGPEGAEYYVVLEGSTLDHLTAAHHTADRKSLVFNAPGHNLEESVSVGVYMCVGGDEATEVLPLSPSPAPVCLRYEWDEVQALAQLLMGQSGPLSSSSYRDILSRLCTGRRLQVRQPGEREGGDLDTSSPGQTETEIPAAEEPSDRDGCGAQETGNLGNEPVGDLKTLDGPLTLALANMTYPREWNSLDAKHSKDQGELPRETALHLAVRLGLPQLCCFLVQQPGGQKVVTLPNEEGDTPLCLAERRGDQPLVAALTAFPEPSSPALISQVCVDSSSVLRVCSTSGIPSLTTKHTYGTHTDACVRIHTYRQKMREMREETRKTKESEGHSSCGDVKRGLFLEDHLVVDNVFEEQLVLSLDEDEDPIPSKPETSCSFLASSKQGLKHTLTHPTISAAARLSAMLNGKGQVDPEEKMTVAGVTGESTATEGEAEPLTDTPPPESSPLSSPSPPHLALARFLRSSRPQPTNHTESPPTTGSCDLSLSPTLVALEVASEDDDDDDVMKTLESNGDERDIIDPAPQHTCTRTLSASSAQSHTPAKTASADQGVRLRSYSYSSPKISLLPPRFSRDTHTHTSESTQDGALPSSSGSRSLLQALPLSKSLYLLNPVKQRALSLTEQTQEKRELRFRRRAQSAEDESSVELADSLQHLTLSEFLKEIEEEDWDRFIIPSKIESEKYKVSRTFSFLKSRMSSTRNKNKSKAKDREGRDRQANGHLFSSGSCSTHTLCLVCDKTAAGKDLLHCSNCSLTVHKGCRDSATPCLKKLQDKYAISNVKTRTSSLPQNFTVHESSSVGPLLSTSASLPMMVSRDSRKDSSSQATLSRSVPTATECESLEGDADPSSWRNHTQSDETLQKAESSTSTDSSFVEDVVDSPLQKELVGASAELEAESWSLSVDSDFCRSQESAVIKRQDVIYELMQTELHHVQTLSIMAEVFRRGLKEEVQLDADAIGRIFPCLDELLPLHRDFLSALRERRHSSTHFSDGRNYIILRIGDILLKQFSGETAEQMKQVYGQFCGHHTEAVSLFKELQQHNKRFQTFIKQQSSNSLVRRREIPECILLVTQRITKYPVLLERILQHTQEGSVEHAQVWRALVLIRELISSVDQQVRVHEQEQRVLEVLSRLENKSIAKLKNGHTFRKHDLQARQHTLTHQGLLYWKTATGRLKDVLAMLLKDTLIFLQEKDQKYTFATVDQKPPVISLQKLIVREVANEERGMFLISASSAGPEMYEVYSPSRDERNTWMRLIRAAVDSCPEEDEEDTSESEEEKRVCEARVQRIQQIQESLVGQDQLICSALEEKLQIYSELNSLHHPAAPETHTRLQLSSNTHQLPQAAAILNAALREVETLKNTLSFYCELLSPCPLPSLPPITPPLVDLIPTGSPRATPPDCESSLLETTPPLQEDPLSPDTPISPHPPADHPLNINAKVSQSVQSLTQLLYSLLAAVTIQDSCFEIQKLLLSSSPHPSPSGPTPLRQVSSSSSSSSSLAASGVCLRGSALQEQERQREAERLREEMAEVARLQAQLTQDQQQWERECTAWHLQQEEAESRVEAREQHCHLEAERLRRERHLLDEQQLDYQLSLERLREGQRSLDREQQQLATHHRLLQRWRQTHTLIDSVQDTHVPRLEEGSVFVNEVMYQRNSLNNRFLHQQPRHPHPPLQPPQTHNSINALLDHSAQRHTHTHTHTHTQGQHPAANVAHIRTTTDLPQDQPSNELNMSGVIGEDWPPGSSGMTFPGHPQPFLLEPYQITIETEVGEDGVEENIVYL